MITSTVNGTQRFGEITLAVERDVKVALEKAAVVGAATANELAGKYTSFHPSPVRGTVYGYESGVNAANRLMANLYDKGTLGKRRGKLKQPGRRKDSWTVTQGKRTYVAHRRDTAGKGVEGVHWGGKSRTAGRRALFSALDRL